MSMKWWASSHHAKMLPSSTSSRNRMGLRLVTNSYCQSEITAPTNTQTWPLAKVKKRKSSSLDRRPQTATLDHPVLLNENLINVLDMSLVTKELLQISNLCQQEPRKRNRPKTIIKRVKKAITPSKPLTPKVKNRDANNNRKNIKTSTTFTKLNDTENYIFGGLPVPCKTCGRSDQPERFHSHPATPRFNFHKCPSLDSKTKVLLPINNQKLKDQAEPVTPKKSPYLSKMNFAKSKCSGARPSSTPRRPPIKTCYLCGREFGWASLPFHEPKCLERWERENEKLPINLRRKAPPKPKEMLSVDDWNERAWANAMLSLVPCENCGRKFQIEALEVHSRSCRTDKVNSTSNSWVSPGHGPLTVECYICGRKFGTRSISIHKPQCLKKWHAQNNALPPKERLKPPTDPKSSPISLKSPRPPSTTSRPTSGVPRTTNTALSRLQQEPRVTKRTVACYLCGREFIPSSLKFHEPECLKKWNNENEKLPLSQRRKPPVKPDIIFTDIGDVDFQATFKRIWDNHCDSLEKCFKCNRTFFPDRITQHVKVCDGTQKLIKNSLLKAA